MFSVPRHQLCSVRNVASQVPNMVHLWCMCPLALCLISALYNEIAFACVFCIDCDVGLLDDLIKSAPMVTTTGTRLSSIRRGTDATVAAEEGLLRVMLVRYCSLTWARVICCLFSLLQVSRRALACLPHSHDDWWHPPELLFMAEHMDVAAVTETIACCHPGGALRLRLSLATVTISLPVAALTAGDADISNAALPFRGVLELP